MTVSQTVPFIVYSAQGSNGRELWVTDGTDADTALLKDIRTDTDGPNLRGFTATGDGKMMFITDGTQAGTVRLSQLNPSASGSPSGFGKGSVTVTIDANDDAFSLAANGTLSGNVLADNGSGADTGTQLAVSAVNGTALQSGATVTLADGTSLTGADFLVV